MPKPIQLPYPPSANRLWRAVNGRNIESREYRSWKREAALMIMTQRPGKVTGRYLLTIVATRPDRRRRDIGNLEKPISDALQEAGVIGDDCDAQSIRISWSEGAPDPKAFVFATVEPITLEPAQ